MITFKCQGVKEETSVVDESGNDIVERDHGDNNLVTMFILSLLVSCLHSVGISILHPRLSILFLDYSRFTNQVGKESLVIFW